MTKDLQLVFSLFQIQMGKGHKDRRREKRAQEVEERDKDERLLKEELAEENDKKIEFKQNDKLTETCS
jgi:hypothetical protein